MVKVFKPMRSCAVVAKHPLRYGSKGRLESPKLDGIRCCIKGGKAVTKSCLPIPNHHIRNWLEANVPEGMDGELISGSPTDEECYSRTFSAVMTQKGEPEFTFYVFDLCNDLATPASLRKATAMVMCESLDARVKFVQQVKVFSQEESDALYASYLAQGYEGLMSVDPDGLYKYGRATPVAQEQIKRKPEEDFDAEILDTYEAQVNENAAYTNEAGETQRSTHAENKSSKGMVGGYVVRDILTDTVFKVSAGKMKHPARYAEWEAYKKNPQHRKGGYLKYRKMTYGAMANGAARHGRWVGWIDPSEIDLSEAKGTVCNP